MKMKTEMGSLIMGYSQIPEIKALLPKRRLDRIAGVADKIHGQEMPMGKSTERQKFVRTLANLDKRFATTYKQLKTGILEKHSDIFTHENGQLNLAYNLEEKPLKKAFEMLMAVTLFRKNN